MLLFLPLKPTCAFFENPDPPLAPLPLSTPPVRPPPQPPPNLPSRPPAKPPDLCPSQLSPCKLCFLFSRPFYVAYLCFIPVLSHFLPWLVVSSGRILCSFRKHPCDIVVPWPLAILLASFLLASPHPLRALSFETKVTGAIWPSNTGRVWTFRLSLYTNFVGVLFHFWGAACLLGGGADYVEADLLGHRNLVQGGVIWSRLLWWVSTVGLTCLHEDELL